MLKQLSHYTDGQLEYLLARVREIAALGDEAAIIETDKLVWEIMGDEMEGDGYVATLSPDDEGASPPTVPFHDQPAHALERRISHIEFSHERLKRHLRDGYLNHWIVLQFDRDINGDGNYWGPIDLEDERLVRLVGEYQKSLDDAWHIVVPKTLKECASWTFKNIASVSSMMTDLEQVVGGYTQHHALTEEMQRIIRDAKERGARFRWGKKISDAEVAEAAGYVGKAVGLRKEAEALLVKDWAMVFGGEEPPKKEAVIETATEENSDVEGIEINDADMGDGMDGDDAVMPGHEPEIMLTEVYCPDCNATYELESASYPGGRESAPLTCPDCDKLLGGSFESGWTVEKRTEGDTRKRWSVGPPRIF
jgi:hypothetical protein